jgi:hypothetical protein
MKATAKYRVPKQQSGKVTVPRFMDYFYQFPKKQQSLIAGQINQATFSQRWLALDKILPDADISEDEIMKQVKAVRNGRKKNKNRS